MAVILTLANNNPIENAKKATFQNDIKTMQEELNLYVSSKYLNNRTSSVSINLSGEGMVTELPSTSNYKDKVEVKNGKLIYTDESNMTEWDWANEILGGNTILQVANTTDDTTNQITLTDVANSTLENYTIYGNTTSEGSVGDLVVEGDSDYTEETKGKYRIPITVSGKNLFDESRLTTVSGVTKNDSGYYEVAIYPASYGSFVNKVLKAGVTYTLSRKISNYSSAASGNIRFVSGSSNVVVDVGNYKNGISSRTFSLDQEKIDSIGRIFVYGNKNNPTIYEYIQLEEGSTATEYEPYVEPVTNNIYLSEPLRKIGDYVDYIDFKKGKVVRNVQENDGTLEGLSTPKEESVDDLPTITTTAKTNIIICDTSVSSSKITVIY